MIARLGLYYAKYIKACKRYLGKHWDFLDSHVELSSTWISALKYFMYTSIEIATTTIVKIIIQLAKRSLKSLV